MELRDHNSDKTCRPPSPRVKLGDEQQVIALWKNFQKTNVKGKLIDQIFREWFTKLIIATRYGLRLRLRLRLRPTATPTAYGLRLRLRQSRYAGHRHGYGYGYITYAAVQAATPATGAPGGGGGGSGGSVWLIMPAFILPDNFILPGCRFALEPSGLALGHRHLNI